MGAIKVLIVDDSALVRKVLRAGLETDSHIEVVGAVRDPLYAMEFMEKGGAPDVIVLDVEMPRMDGLTFLEKLMAEQPVPVMMCSSFTDQHSQEGVRALSLGAVDVIKKPSTGLKAFLEEQAPQLVSAVKTASHVNLKAVRRKRATPTAIQPKQSADAILPKRRAQRVSGAVDPVVAIGASTGGTQALLNVLMALPADSPPIVVVQHMPENFTRAFADRLNSICKVEVKEAEDYDEVRPGRVLIAPGGHHMVVVRSGVKTTVSIKDGPPVNRHRPSVDVLFRSVAGAFGSHAMGVIMTGMGDDGAEGMKEMHDAGAVTVAQDEATCVVYGMPAEAVKRGGVDREVPLDGIADEVSRYHRNNP